MRKAFILTICAFVVLGLAVSIPSIARAVCTASDGIGTWNIYVTNAGDNQMSWQRFKMTITNTLGTVKSGTKGAGSDNTTFTITGGKMTGNAACTGSGWLTIDPDGDTGPFKVTISQFALDRTKGVIMGVGKDPDLIPFTFMGVKQ